MKSEIKQAIIMTAVLCAGIALIGLCMWSVI